MTNIRLWSVHDEPYWEHVRRTGRFEVDSMQAEAFGCLLPEAYAWMREQVARRVAEPSGGWPLWAWPVRPDMRSQAVTSQEVQRVVLLELSVPENKVVFSDYSDWHLVLNDGYHPTKAEEDDEGFWDSDEWNRKDEDRAIKVASWERIFDLEPGDHVQACIDGPQLEWVRAFRYFKRRRPAMRLR